MKYRTHKVQGTDEYITQKAQGKIHTHLASLFTHLAALFTNLASLFASPFTHQAPFSPTQLHFIQMALLIFQVDRLATSRPLSDSPGPLVTPLAPQRPPGPLVTPWPLRDPPGPSETPWPL